MKEEEKNYCPKCDSKHTDLISYIYRRLESENAGQEMFVDGIETALDKKRQFLNEKSQELIKKFKPPVESKVSFPAATTALLAFALSWIIVGSLLITKIGEMFYFYSTIAVILGVSYPFYMTMQDIIAQVHKNYLRYRKLKSVWVKKYYCYDCKLLFIPGSKEAQEIKANRKTKIKRI